MNFKGVQDVYYNDEPEFFVVVWDEKDHIFNEGNYVHYYRFYRSQYKKHGVSCICI